MKYHPSDGSKVSGDTFVAQSRSITDPPDAGSTPPRSVKSYSGVIISPGVSPAPPDLSRKRLFLPVSVRPGYATARIESVTRILMHKFRRTGPSVLAACHSEVGELRPFKIVVCSHAASCNVHQSSAAVYIACGNADTSPYCPTVKRAVYCQSNFATYPRQCRVTPSLPERECSIPLCAPTYGSSNSRKSESVGGSISSFNCNDNSRRP